MPAGAQTQSKSLEVKPPVHHQQQSQSQSNSIRTPAAGFQQRMPPALCSSVAFRPIEQIPSRVAVLLACRTLGPVQ
jgi:hypothetical protein